MMKYQKITKFKALSQILLIVILTFSSFFFNPLAVFAQTNQPQTDQKTCIIGAYILGLDKLDPVGKTFDTNFWTWTVCPQEDLNPLETLEIINAKKLEVFNSVAEKKKDTFNIFPDTDTVYWNQTKYNATLSYNWDLSNYPFDRHTLSIGLEEGLYDTSKFVFTPDRKNSSYKDQLNLTDWRITNFNVSTINNPYNTTFGDPELAARSSSFSQFLVEISLERISKLSFLNLTIGVYIAMLIAFLSFFLKVGEQIGPRIILLVACLFTSLVSMQISESVLGNTANLSLIDKIHITSIFYLAFSAVISIYSYFLDSKGKTEQSLKIDRKIAFPVFSISFIIFNLILIFNAVKAG